MAEAPRNQPSSPPGDARLTPTLVGRVRGAVPMAPVGGLAKPSELVNDAVVHGRYRIVKHPNRWAVGSAYPAQDLERRESVVLVLPELAPDQGPGFVQRARVEVERTRRLQGGHIVTLRDCGMLTEGLPYFVIRRVQGNSLLRAVANNGPFSTEMALHVLERLLHHIADAHAAGIVLGDIRPANIILTERKGADDLPVLEPEVVDMAFARGLFDGLMSLPEPPMAYRSPEMRAGHPLTVADDVYALGAVLYFTLTGKAPRAQSVDDARVAPAPSLARPDLGLSAYVDKVVQTALAARRNDRYAGIRPFQDAVMGLRELFSLSDAARGVLHMADQTSQVDGFESDPTQEFGRELVETIATKALASSPPQPNRLDQTQPFDPRELEVALRQHERAEAGGHAHTPAQGSPQVRFVDTTPIRDQSDDVMTSVNGDATAPHPALPRDLRHEDQTIRAEARTFPWEPLELPPEEGAADESAGQAHPPPALPGSQGDSDTTMNLPALRPRQTGTLPAALSSSVRSSPSLVLVPGGPRAPADAAHVLQAARDHENPFLFAPLRLDAEVRSVNAPSTATMDAPKASTAEASFWRGVVFTAVFFGLALALGYLLFRSPEVAPPAAPPPAAEYLPSTPVPQPARFEPPAPASVAPPVMGGPALAPAGTQSSAPISPASSAAAPSPGAPVSAVAPASVAAVAAVEAGDPKADEDNSGKAGDVVHLVLHLTPENTRVLRAKTGEVLCTGTPCRLARPRLAPRGFLKIRLSAPGMRDKIDHVPLHQDAVYYFAMTPPAKARTDAGEDKPVAREKPAAPASAVAAPASAVAPPAPDDPPLLDDLPVVPPPPSRELIQPF